MTMKYGVEYNNNERGNYMDVCRLMTAKAHHFGADKYMVVLAIPEEHQTPEVREAIVKAFASVGRTWNPDDNLLVLSFLAEPDELKDSVKVLDSFYFLEFIGTIVFAPATRVAIMSPRLPKYQAHLESIALHFNSSR